MYPQDPGAEQRVVGMMMPLDADPFLLHGKVVAEHPTVGVKNGFPE